MRASINMSDAPVQALDTLAKQQRQSRSALIRLAIDGYLRRRHRKQVEDGFGLWGTRKIDDLSYQGAVRDEWH